MLNTNEAKNNIESVILDRAQASAHALHAESGNKLENTYQVLATSGIDNERKNIEGVINSFAKSMADGLEEVAREIPGDGTNS